MNTYLLAVFAVVVIGVVNSQGQLANVGGAETNSALAVNQQNVDQSQAQLSKADKKALRLQRRKARKERKAERKSLRAARRQAREQALNAQSIDQQASASNVDAGFQRASKSGLSLNLNVLEEDSEAGFLRASEADQSNRQNLLQVKDNLLAVEEIEAEEQGQAELEDIDYIAVDALDEGQLGAQEAVNRQNINQIQAQEQARIQQQQRQNGLFGGR